MIQDMAQQLGRDYVRSEPMNLAGSLVIAAFAVLWIVLDPWRRWQSHRRVDRDAQARLRYPPRSGPRDAIQDWQPPRDRR